MGDLIQQIDSWVLTDSELDRDSKMTDTIDF
jgi:hypothetical protein